MKQFASYLGKVSSVYSVLWGDCMKSLFIINPAAGKKKGLEFIKAFEEEIKGKTEYVIEVTQGKGEATAIARKYSQQDDYIIYAVGGDGTVNEVVNGMAGSNSVLAILPTGSGNDMVRSLYPSCSNEELLRKLLEGTIKPIDLYKVEDKYFLNIASVGLDADIVFNADKYKQKAYIKGELAYLISLFKTLLGPKGVEAQVYFDDQKVYDGRFLLLTVSNGKYYGGGIPITPHAIIDDGLPDVCFIKETRLSKLMPVLPKVFRSAHEEADIVEVYHPKKVELVGGQNFRANIDGEIWETDHISMQVLPQGIKVLVPTNKE